MENHSCYFHVNADSDSCEHGFATVLYFALDENLIFSPSYSWLMIL